MKIPAKEILYRGGIAKFAIPENWIEEYEPSGGATFYEDVPHSGTLRLNVLEFSRGKSEKSPFASDDYDNYRDDLYLKTESSRFTEDGDECVLLNWAVGYLIEGANFRVASFNHTVEAQHFRSDQTKMELDVIKSILWTADFGREAGESGNYHHPKA